MELPEKLYEVLKHEGVVSIVSWGNTEPHILTLGILILKLKKEIAINPRKDHSTEDDVKVNNKK